VCVCVCVCVRVSLWVGNTIVSVVGALKAPGDCSCGAGCEGALLAAGRRRRDVFGGAGVRARGRRGRCRLAGAPPRLAGGGVGARISFRLCSNLSPPSLDCGQDHMYVPYHRVGLYVCMYVQLRAFMYRLVLFVCMYVCMLVCMYVRLDDTYTLPDGMVHTYGPDRNPGQ
jgi:hypothetical protein